MKLALLLSLFLILGSCNITKLVTGGKTRVDDNIFCEDCNNDDETDAFVYYITAGGDLIKTNLNNFEISTVLSGITNQSKLYQLENYLYFSANISGDHELYKIEIDTNELSKFDLNNAGSSFPDGLAFVKGQIVFRAYFSGAYHLCTVDNFLENPNCDNTTNYGAASLYYAVGSNSSNKYLLCDDFNSNALEYTFADSGTYPRSIATNGFTCSTSQYEGFMHNEFVIQTTGGDLEVYDSLNSTLDTTNLTGGTFSSLYLSHDGFFFFQDLTNQNLWVYDISNNNVNNSVTLTIEDGVYDPTNTTFFQTEESLFYTDNYSGADQVYMSDHDGTNVTRITDFSSATQIRYITGYREHLFVFSNNGVYRLSEGFEEQINTDYSIGYENITVYEY